MAEQRLKRAEYRAEDRLAMKMVFTDRSVVPCDFLKSMLEAEGIPCVIRNEYGTHLLGYGYPVPGGSALPWAWPEIWIPEEDYECARPLIEQFQESQRKRRCPGGQDGGPLSK